MNIRKHVVTEKPLLKLDKQHWLQLKEGGIRRKGEGWESSERGCEANRRTEKKKKRNYIDIECT